MPKLRPPERDNLSRQAYDSLRRAILGRTLPAGEKLVMRDLVEQLQLSPTPINQALMALENEGLVESRPHRGYYVIALEPEDVLEIYTLREVIEGLAIKLAIHADGTKLGRVLKKLQQSQLACGRRGDLPGYADLDLAFHRAIWEASGNSRLLRVSEMLMGQVRLLITTSAEVEGRLDSSIEEHDQIVQHVTEGDSDAAEAAMRLHVRNAARALSHHFDVAIPGNLERSVP